MILPKEPLSPVSGHLPSPYPSPRHLNLFPVTSASSGHFLLTGWCFQHSCMLKHESAIPSCIWSICPLASGQFVIYVFQFQQPGCWTWVIPSKFMDNIAVDTCILVFYSFIYLQLFIFCHAQWCSGFTPGSVLRDHSWQGLGDHMGCGDPTWVSTYEANTHPLYYCSNPHVHVFMGSSLRLIDVGSLLCSPVSFSFLLGSAVLGFIMCSSFVHVSFLKFLKIKSHNLQSYL